MNTYCDKINDNELSLHSTPEEMAFMLDLINAVEHPIATKLRNRIEPHVRSNQNFQLNIERKIEICGKCKGEGTLMVGKHELKFVKKNIRKIICNNFFMSTSLI